MNRGLKNSPASTAIAALVEQSVRGYAVVSIVSILVSCFFVFVRFSLNDLDNLPVSAPPEIDIKRVAVAGLVAPLFEAFICMMLIYSTFFICRKASLQAHTAAILSLALVFLFGALTHAGRQGLLGVPAGIVFVLFSTPLIARRMDQSQTSGLLPSVLIHSAHNVFLLTVALSLPLI